MSLVEYSRSSFYISVQPFNVVDYTVLLQPCVELHVIPTKGRIDPIGKE